MMRFDRFTERAQEAAQRAAEIIQRYGHNQIDTEHILLALIEQPGGVIPQILEKLSVSPEALTERLDATFRAAIAGCRERTQRHIALPPGESFTVEYVTQQEILTPLPLRVRLPASYGAEHVVAVDVVEVAPPFDTAEVTAAAAHRCVLEAISALAARRRDAGAPSFPRASEILAHECGQSYQARRWGALYLVIGALYTWWREGRHWWNWFENQASETGQFGGILSGSVHDDLWAAVHSHGGEKGCRLS